MHVQLCVDVSVHVGARACKSKLFDECQCGCTANIDLSDDVLNDAVHSRKECMSSHRHLYAREICFAVCVFQ